LQPRLRGLPPDLPFVFDERALQLGINFTLLVGNEELDLLAEMSAIGGYEQIIGQAQEITVGSIKAKVLSLSQLIATKEAAGRLKDLAVVPLIRATLEFREKQKALGNDPPAGP
jgi:predicted nucleotidyltransferase